MNFKQSIDNTHEYTPSNMCFGGEGAGAGGGNGIGLGGMMGTGSTSDPDAPGGYGNTPGGIGSGPTGDSNNGANTGGAMQGTGSVSDPNAPGGYGNAPGGIAAGNTQGTPQGGGNPDAGRSNDIIRRAAAGAVSPQATATQSTGSLVSEDPRIVQTGTVRVIKRRLF